jgi:hypothetical protein
MSLRIDFEVILSLPIPITQKLVLLALLRYRNGQTGLCFPGIALIMRAASLQRTAVIDALRELALAGYVTVEEPGGGKGRRTGYVLTLPQYAAGTAPECAPANSPPHERFADPNSTRTVRQTGLYGPSGGFSKTNKELNTFNTGEHRFPPVRAMGGANGKTSRLDQAIANIAAARAQRR